MTEKQKKWVRWAVCLGGMAVCAAGIIVAVGMLSGDSHQESTNAGMQTSSQIQTEAAAANEHIQEKESGTASALENIDWDAVVEEMEREPEILPEYAELKKEMPDLAGWLKIDGTEIDFPVVQKDNEYYMTHDAYGNEAPDGAVFLEQVNDIKTPDNNLMMYGHNRKNGKMFGLLMAYKDQAYYEEHPYIQFDTLYEKGTYEIISVFLSKVYYTTDTNFKYYQFFGSQNPEQFENYVVNVKALSLYPIEADAEFGDELITLSTCEYSVENGRMAIVAKKVQ